MKNKIGYHNFNITCWFNYWNTKKKKKVEILNDIEKYDRDFYTEFWGILMGENLDSAVMIRFIEVDKMAKFIIKVVVE